MSSREFFDSRTTRTAYLGKHCFDLLTLSSEQASEVYAQRGLLIPLEVSSTLEYIHRRKSLSVADLSKALRLKHQLVTQRVEKLVKAGLVKRKPDPNDNRRYILQLNKKGREQADLLQQCMKDIASIYEQMFEEIGCDLSDKLPAATAALQSKSIAERLAETSGSSKHQCSLNSTS